MEKDKKKHGSCRSHLMSCEDSSEPTRMIFPVFPLLSALSSVVCQQTTDGGTTDAGKDKKESDSRSSHFMSCL